MALTVKQGREYVLGGKVYHAGETVEGVPEKFIRILTGPKGPLQEGVAVNKTDLPKKTKPEPAQDIDVVTPALRAEYEVLVGKRPFMGWDADELRQKMQEYRTEALRADAPGEYQTRVMRAEE